jgi:predicted ATPase with chaperone activity
VVAGAGEAIGGLGEGQVAIADGAEEFDETNVAPNEGFSLVAGGAFSPSGFNGIPPITRLMSATTEITVPEKPQHEGFCPPVPQTLEDTGLNESMVQQLLLKCMYFRGEMVGRELAKVLGVNFSIIEATMEYFRQHHLVAVKRSLGMGLVSNVYTLSEQGRTLATKYLDSNTYAGRAPVPLSQYTAAVKAQKQPPNWLTKDSLRGAFRHMVVSDEFLSQIGPAVNAGRSFLLYGQPGNGKTFAAEAIFRIEAEPVYIPYAIECHGQIVQMYDPLYHVRVNPEEDDGNSIWMVDEEKLHDARWILVRRPFVVTGGELTLDMLDLAFKPDSKIYDAPFQLKANNGIYLIDDFGRQRVSPAEVLNRWIVPMEKGLDYLNFLSGGKMAVPFECFLVFSTNLRPEQIGDEAFLRRIQYKMYMKNPTEEEFAVIFRRQAASLNLPIVPGALGFLLERRFRSTGKKLRRCQPRDLITHAVDLIRFEGLRYELSAEVLDRAFESTFVTDQYEA